MQIFTNALAISAASALVLAACATPPPPVPPPPAMEAAPAPPPVDPALGKTLTAPILNLKGASIGSAAFAEGPKGVLIRVTILPGKLAPGWHGLHLHEIGDCADASMGFKASGKHMGHAESVQHGLLSPAGPEAGDLPNLYVASARAAVGGEFFSPTTTLAGEAFEGRTPLLDADGAALIIHANPDDETSQPVGGAGDRLACAALK